MLSLYYAFYIAASIIVFFQDLKSRMVSLWVLIIAMISSCLISSIEVKYVLINVGFLLIQLLAVYLYSKLTKRLILSESLGLGDVVFFIVPALLLYTPEFVVYFIVSLIVSCLLTLLLNWKTIPLAGIQSVCLLLWLLCRNFNKLNAYFISWF